jgi:hypothetical protein
VTRITRLARDVSQRSSLSHLTHISASVFAHAFYVPSSGTATGRTCDGYDPLPVNAVPKFIAMVPSAVRQEESRSLQFFYEKTLAQLTVFFQDEFWTRQVLQVANSDKCIRHSLVALSSYHEAFSTPKPANQSQFALRHYNLSISGILGSSRTAENAHIHLMSCIVFICIEVSILFSPQPKTSRADQPPPSTGTTGTYTDCGTACQSRMEDSSRAKPAGK